MEAIVAVGAMASMRELRRPWAATLARTASQRGEVAAP
jgi:hypothetical protein